jgi:uncharacterized protein (TIGR03437 family)
VVAPFDLSVGQNASIRIVQTGQTTTELSAAVQEFQPALVTLNYSGLSSAAALNEDGSVNSSSRPAQPGSVVSLFMTGMGMVNPPIVEGTTATRPGTVATVPEVTVFNSKAEVLYAGPAPGLLAGVYQVNIRVPATFFENWVPLQIRTIDHSGKPIAASINAGIYLKCTEGQSCRQWEF